MVFKIKDLMITDLAAARGGGSVGMPTPTEPTPPTTISPIAAVALLSPKMEAIGGRLAELDRAYLDALVVDVGRAVVGTAIVGQCAQDQATCDANPTISPVATEFDHVLRNADLATITAQVMNAAEWVQGQGAELERRTFERAGDLAGRLREAADILERGGKG